MLKSISQQLSELYDGVIELTVLGDDTNEDLNDNSVNSDTEIIEVPTT